VPTDKAPFMDPTVSLTGQTELFSHARLSVLVCGTDGQVWNISTLWQPFTWYWIQYISYAIASDSLVNCEERSSEDW